LEAISNSPDAIARAFLRAINTHDVDSLTALLTPGHRMIDSLGGIVEGREKICECWKGYFRMVPDYAVEIEETFVSGSAVVILGVARGTLSLDDVLHPENRWHTPLAVRASVEGSLISEWRIFADNEPIRKLMAAQQNARCNQQSIG
jgi:ketosteroid isomerase-like protein